MKDATELHLSDKEPRHSSSELLLPDKKPRRSSSELLLSDRVPCPAVRKAPIPPGSARANLKEGLSESQRFEEGRLDICVVFSR